MGKEKPLIITHDIPCLNVDKLSNDVVNTIQELRQRIASGNHDDLAERINNRLDILGKENFEERETLC
jgi:BMFP domain-containing protein YqiC